MKAVDTRKDVHAWRVKAWQPPIISRNHQIDDVFVKGDEQLMLRGRVTYGKDDGSEGSATCGAWMVFAPGEELKIQSYTVWVVSARDSVAPHEADQLTRPHPQTPEQK